LYAEKAIKKLANLTFLAHIAALAPTATVAAAVTFRTWQQGLLINHISDIR